MEHEVEDAQATQPKTDRVTFWRPFTAALLTALAFDIGVYRGHGYTGCAVFFGVSLLSYLVGGLTTKAHRSTWLLAVMLALIVVRLVWLGSPGLFVCGVLLLPALAMACHGMAPYLMDLVMFSLQSIVAGAYDLLVFVLEERENKSKSTAIDSIKLMGIVAPVVTVLVFAVIFVQANPDLATSFGSLLGDFGDMLLKFVNRFDIDVLDVFFVGSIGWIALGQLSPLMKKPLSSLLNMSTEESASAVQESSVYAPFRNTLVSVTILFAVYLVFEFSTLWFREFPEGFYYAGYAHQGAAWLTFALALATLMLSAIFRGSLLHDPRIARLKVWAWLWSALNFLLGISVYNRMWIYIDFNGMTRMRVLGLFGITTVMVGFGLVVWKIYRQRRFGWLIQRHLWTLACGLYLLAVTPVDYLVHSCNARQILAGDLAPSVQITEHSVDASGWSVLVSLVDCEDATIREGIRAKLAELYFHPPVRDRIFGERTGHWSELQLAERELQQKLKSRSDLWQQYKPPEKRTKLWQSYKEYAYQWY